MLELITVASRLGLWTGNYRGSDCFCRRIAVAESLLAFSSKQPMLVIMEKSWLGKMFSTSQKPKSAMVPATVDLADAEVQFGLGLKFASGTGAAQDYAQAADWYRKAAEQNHGLAQFNLGTMYARGQGVARDDAQSVVWFGRAANLTVVSLFDDREEIGRAHV